MFAADKCSSVMCLVCKCVVDGGLVTVLPDIVGVAEFVRKTAVT